MELSIERVDRISLVTVSGKVLPSDACEFGAALDYELDTYQLNIKLILSDAEFGSATLREMVRIQKRMMRTIILTEGVVIVNPSAQVLESLDLAELDTVFEIRYEKD